MQFLVKLIIWSRVDILVIAFYFITCCIIFVFVRLIKLSQTKRLRIHFHVTILPAWVNNICIYHLNASLKYSLCCVLVSV